MANYKKLKEQSEISVNVVDVCNILFPGYKPKFKELMVLLLKNKIKNLNNNDQIAKNIYSTLNEVYNIKKTLSDETLFSFLMIDRIISYDDFRYFKDFIKYYQNNLIERKDLSTYKTFNDIINQVRLAEINSLKKVEDDEYEKVIINNDWWFLIPYTHEASVKYGYDTKWCTSMINEPYRFYDYIEMGFLLYIFNKRNNKKYAMFIETREKNYTNVMFYNSEDMKVDGLTLNFPRLIQQKLLKYVSLNKTNKELWPKSLRQREPITNALNGRSVSMYPGAAILDMYPEPVRADETEPPLLMTFT
jgi:hypothetical protein